MRHDEKLELDIGRYLAAGLAVSAVAGAASYVVYLIGSVFSEDPLAVPASPSSQRLVELTGSDAFRSSFIAGIVATGILWILIALVPTPTRFFGWLGGLFAVAVTVLPFSFTDDLTMANKFWLAAINLVGALTIISLFLGIVPRVMKPPATESATPQPPSTGF